MLRVLQFSAPAPRQSGWIDFRLAKTRSLHEDTLFSSLAVKVEDQPNRYEKNWGPEMTECTDSSIKEVAEKIRMASIRFPHADAAFCETNLIRSHTPVRRPKRLNAKFVRLEMRNV
jgi:hypothetical protein